MDLSASRKHDEELNYVNIPGMVEITCKTVPYYGNSTSSTNCVDVVADRCQQPVHERAVRKCGDSSPEHAGNIASDEVTVAASIESDVRITAKLTADKSVNPVSYCSPHLEVVGDEDATVIAERMVPSDATSNEVLALRDVPDPVTGGESKNEQGAIDDQHALTPQGSGISLSGNQHVTDKDASSVDSHERFSGEKSSCLARRMSSWGSFSRTVLIAIDASGHAKYAFECKLVDYIITYQIIFTPLKSQLYIG
jgi:hypothetical protein